MGDWLRHKWPLLVVLALGCWLTVRLGRQLAELSARRVRRAARGWVTLDLGSIRVCHPPDLLDRVVGDRLDRVLLDEVARLAGWFGAALPAPPTLFLFPALADLQRLFGGAGGYAVCDPGWIAVPDGDDPDWFRAILRHELTHLHAYRFAGRRPPLFEEGLAGLVMLFAPDWPPDRLPPPADWRGRLEPPPADWPSPGRLLDAGYFFARKRRNRSYAAAASFAAFLVRRHGWEKYLRFYQRCDRQPLFAAVRFRRTFGQSLRAAERDWRAGR